MPTRVAVVTAGPLPRRARRPQPRWDRLRTRVLIGMLAALIATLAPVESPVPLGPLEDLPGATPAEAQTPAVGPGRPDPCPAPLRVDRGDTSLCVLSRPACPEHPLQTGSFLAPSTEFPDFCEASVLQSVDPGAYAACAAPLNGYVIKTFAQGGDQVCRIIRPTQCVQSMHRTGTNTCRQVQRRTWTCPSGTPTNRFDTCYQAPADYTGAHPACGTGAPSFAISSCEDYVSQDFVRAPALVPCANFNTGDTRSALRNLAGSSNLHWCQFNSSYLDVGCYATGAACPTADAVCVKRASTTGGCDAMANALRCRKLQADYLDGSATADAVYLDGCVPCQVLPFSPTPPECPRDLRVDPARSSGTRLEDTHQRRRDTGPGGSTTTLCTDPPRGRLVWESSHHAGFAIVNSPVILRVIDIPSTTRNFSTVQPSINHRTGEASFWLSTRQYFEYPDGTPSDPVVRAWSAFDDTLSFSNVNEIVGATRLTPGSPHYTNSGPCLVRVRPDFRIRVEELWPDIDASEIQALFGADALDWWTAPALTEAQQRSRTEARGLNYVGSTATAAERAAEQARRAGSLTQTVRCNYGADVWCNWRPTRPGYYRLVAAGAWYMSKFGPRRWHNTSARTSIDNALADMFANANGTCTRTPGSRSHRDYECLIEDLARANQSPAEAGLASDLSGLLPAGGNDEWLYTAAAGPYVICPPRDMRVRCSGTSTGESSNYTETEPIGIVVHEVRVSTVTPDG